MHRNIPNIRLWALVARPSKLIFQSSEEFHHLGMLLSHTKVEALMSTRLRRFKARRSLAILVAISFCGPSLPFSTTLTGHDLTKILRSLFSLQLLGRVFVQYLLPIIFLFEVSTCELSIPEKLRKEKREASWPITTEH